MNITIYTKESESYITGREYDFKVSGKYQGKFKVINVDGEKVTMGLDEVARAAYEEFMKDTSFKLYSLEVN